MLTIKLSDIAGYTRQDMQDIMQELQNQPFSAALQMELRKVKQKIVDEYNNYMQVRSDTVQKYVPDGAQGIQPGDPGYEDCVRELQEAEAREIELPIEQKLQIPCIVQLMKEKRDVVLTDKTMAFMELFSDFVK